MSTGLGSSGDGGTAGGTGPATGAGPGGATTPMPQLPSGRARHRHGYWIAAGTATGLVALAGGAFALLAGQAPGPARVAAADCGLVRCSATLPAASVVSPAADAAAKPAAKPRPAATHATSPASPVAAQQTAGGQVGGPATPPASTQAPTTAPAPHPARSPAPPAGPPVTVTFTVDQTQGFWGGERFTAHFTVVNHTGAAVTGWTLQAALAGGKVQWVSTSGNGWPWYPYWYRADSGLVISGPQPQEALAAHATTVFYISGWGSGSSLASCSFDGASC